MSVSEERAKELGWTQKHVDAFDNIIYGPPGSSLLEAVQATNSESLKNTVPSPTTSEINDARDNWFSSIPDIIGPSADFIKKHLDIPGSMIGALYGEKYGKKIGHPIKGMITGSAVGAFGGDLSSGFFSEGEDLKTIQPYLNALETGLTTGVLDFATLGIIKFSKPLVNKAGKTVKEGGRKITGLSEDALNWFKSKQILGVSPQQAAKEFGQLMANKFDFGEIVSKSDKMLTAGTPASLRKTQEMLTNLSEKFLPAGQTATLTPLSVFPEGGAGFATTAESIASAGMLSQKSLRNNLDNVATIISGQIQEVIQKGSLATDDFSLGEQVNLIINEGQKALYANYGRGLDTIGSKISPITEKPIKDLTVTNVSPINNAINEFLNDRRRKVGRINFLETTAKNSPVLSVIKDIETKLKMPNLTVDEMLGLDRFLNAQVSSLDTTVASKSKEDLQALGGFIRRGISEALQKVDPQTAKDYAQLKKAYEEGIGGVLGTLNKGTIEAVSKNNNFEILGRLLTTKTLQNPAKIRELMTSIDSSYKLFTPKELKGLSAKTAKEFKNEVRSAWLRKALEATSMEAAEDTTQEIASLTPKLFSSAKVTDYIERQPRAFAAIFEDQAPQVKQLFNGIAEASTKKTSEMFALAVKGREINLLTTLLPVGTGVGVFYGGGGDPLASLLSAGASAMAILFTPVVLAQVAKNKKIVNRLITLANKPKENDKLTAERAGVLLNEIILDIADEEKRAEFTQEVNRVYNFLTEQETEKQQLLNEQKTLSNVLGMNPASGAF